MMALLDTSQDLDQCAAELGCEVGQLVTSHKRPHMRERCLFVTVPDVVGSSRRTLEVFERWAPKLTGWRLAFACQDGQEHLPIPWDEIAAVFIGGSTNWKGSQAAVQIIQAAQLLGKHVHVGRVNGAGRWKHFEELGVDTCDGTGIAQYSEWREAIADRHKQESMFIC